MLNRFLFIVGYIGCMATIMYVIVYIIVIMYFLMYKLLCNLYITIVLCFLCFLCITTMNHRSTQFLYFGLNMGGGGGLKFPNGKRDGGLSSAWHRGHASKTNLCYLFHYKSYLHFELVWVIQSFSYV